MIALLDGVCTSPSKGSRGDLEKHMLMQMFPNSFAAGALSISSNNLRNAGSSQAPSTQGPFVLPSDGKTLWPELTKLFSHDLIHSLKSVFK